MSKRATKQNPQPTDAPTPPHHDEIPAQIAAIIDDGGPDVVARLTALVTVEGLQAYREGHLAGVRRFIDPKPKDGATPASLGTVNLDTIAAQIASVAIENGYAPGTKVWCALVGQTIGKLLKLNRDAFAAVLSEERHRLVRIMELNPHVDCTVQVRTIDVVQGLVANGMLPEGLVAIPEPEQGKP